MASARSQSAYLFPNPQLASLSRISIYQLFKSTLVRGFARPQIVTPCAQAFPGSRSSQQRAAHRDRRHLFQVTPGSIQPPLL